MKKVPDKLPEKFPKKIAEGAGMDYQDPNLAFPKSVKKKRKKGWAEKT